MELLVQSIITVLFVAVIIIHLFAYTRTVGWIKGLRHMIWLPFVPIFMIGIFKGNNGDLRFKALLKIELYLVVMMYLLLIGYIVISFSSLFIPTRIKEYDARLPATKVKIYLNDNLLSKTNHWALDSINSIIRPSYYDFRHILRNMGWNDEQISDATDLNFRYRRNLGLRTSNEEGIFYIQSMDSKLPYLEQILPQLVKRIESRTSGENVSRINTGNGMQEYRLLVVKEWIPGSDNYTAEKLEN